MNALALSLHVLVILLAGMVAFRATRNLAAEFLSATLFGGYALVYGLAPNFLDFPPDGNAQFLIAAASLLTLLGMLGGRQLAREAVGRPSALSPSILTLKVPWRILTLSALTGMAGVLAFAYGAAGSLSAYVASGRFEFRQDPASPLLYLIGLYLIPFLGVPALILSWRKPSRAVGLAAGLGVALFAFYFLKGTRSLAVGVLIGCMVLTVIGIDSWQSNRRPKQHLRAVVAVGLAGGFLMLLLPNMYAARTQLASGEVTPSEILFGSNSETRVDQGSVFEQEPLNYAEFLGDAVVTYPAQTEFLWLYPVRRIVFFPLSSGGLKPPDTNSVFADSIGKGGTNNTTIPPSLPGEGYVVLGGLFGSALWALLYGFALGWLESRLHKPSVALSVLAIGFPTALLALRGQFYELFMSVLVTFFVAWTIIRLARVKSPPQENSDVCTTLPKNLGR